MTEIYVFVFDLKKKKQTKNRITMLHVANNRDIYFLWEGEMDKNW